MKFLSLALLFALSFSLSAADTAPDAEGLPAGSKLVDFGMRTVDLESGKLKSLVWLTDFVGVPPAGKANTTPAPRKKALVMNFYANWCKPCLAEMPLLQKLSEKYGPKEVQFIGVNFRNENENPDAVLAETVKIMKEKKITYPILFDRFTSRNQLVYMGSKAILPTVVIFAPDGTIVLKLQGEKTQNIAEIEKVIEKLIGGK